MANEKLLNFKMGTLAGLKNVTTKAPGTIYVTTDEKAMYLDVDANTRIRLGGGFISVATVEGLVDLLPWQEGTVYHIEDTDVLAFWNGTEWKQINSKLASQVAVIAQDLTDLTAKVGVLPTWEDKTLGSVSAWLSELKGVVTHEDHGNEALLEKIEDLQAIIGEGEEGSFGDVVSRLATVESDLNTAEEKITTLEGSVSSLNTTVGEHATSIGTLQTDLGALKTSYDAHVEAYEAHVEAYEQAIALKADKTALDTAKSDLTGLINGVASDLATEKARAEAAEEELRSDLGGVSGVASGAAAKATENEGKITALTNTVTTNKTAIETSLANEVSTLNSTISSTKTELERKISKEVSDREAAISGLDSAYKAADTGLSNRITTLENSLKAEGEIGSKVSALETTVGQHTTSINDLTSTVGKHTTAIGNINTALDKKATTEALSATQSALEQADAALGLRIDGVVSSLAGTDAKAEQNKKDIAALNTTVGQHTTAIGTINGTLETLQAGLDAAATKEELAGVQEDVEEVAGDLAKTEAKAKQNKTDIATLTSELNTYKNTVSSTYATKEELEAEADTRSEEDGKLAARIAAFEANGANDVAALANRVSAVETKASTNATNIQTNTTNIGVNAGAIKTEKERIDAILADSTLSTFKGVEEAIAASFAANDAMVFKGVINSASDFPSAPQSGWTYKVATAGSYQGKDAKVGDLFIYVVDEAAGTSGWKYIPSGNEDRDTISIGSANAVITVNSQLNDETGSVAFVSGNESIVVDGSTANQIAISMVWGQF